MMLTVVFLVVFMVIITRVIIAVVESQPQNEALNAEKIEKQIKKIRQEIQTLLREKEQTLQMLTPEEREWLDHNLKLAKDLEDSLKK